MTHDPLLTFDDLSQLREGDRPLRDLWRAYNAGEFSRDLPASASTAERERHQRERARIGRLASSSSFVEAVARLDAGAPTKSLTRDLAVAALAATMKPGGPGLGAARDAMAALAGKLLEGDMRTEAAAIRALTDADLESFKPDARAVYEKQKASAALLGPGGVQRDEYAELLAQRGGR